MQSRRNGGSHIILCPVGETFRLYVFNGLIGREDLMNHIVPNLRMDGKRISSKNKWEAYPR